MIPSAALVALACYVAVPSPLKNDDVHRALRGEPMAEVPARQVVADAVRSAAALRRGGLRHGR